MVWEIWERTHNVVLIDIAGDKCSWESAVEDGEWVSKFDVQMRFQLCRRLELVGAVPVVVVPAGAT